MQRIDRPGGTILVGHVMEGLAALPDRSVQTVVTSPPYFGHRSYGSPHQVWGGDPACPHAWENARVYRDTPVRSGGERAGFHEPTTTRAQRWVESADCRACGAWRGELGLEDRPEDYAAHLVEVFTAVRRVLRPDGTLWLNLGDTFASGGRGGGGKQMERRHDGAWAFRADLRGWRSAPPGYKDKDLLGIPWLVAFALRDAGWTLRMDNIWHKPQAMPESVTDRPTRAHEYVFLFSNRGDYWYDPAAVAEAVTGTAHPRGRGVNPKAAAAPDGVRANADFLRAISDRVLTEGKNRRSVWTIPTRPLRDGHHAHFPPELPRLCIEAGTPEGGACVCCGAPSERVSEAAAGPVDQPALWPELIPPPSAARTTWALPCGHSDGVVPATVLDPFAGAGTTPAAATELGRRWVAIELNPRYAAIIARRTAQPPLFTPMTGGRPLVMSTAVHEEQSA